MNSREQKLKRRRKWFSQLPERRQRHLQGIELKNQFHKSLREHLDGVTDPHHKVRIIRELKQTYKRKSL